MGDQLLTVPEVAERLRLSRTATYELVMSGRLPSLKLGKARRVTEAALHEFIARQAVPMSVPGRRANDRFDVVEMPPDEAHLSAAIDTCQHWIDESPDPVRARCVPVGTGGAAGAPARGSGGVTRYPIREPVRGQVIAFHLREDGPDGKRMSWERPDGSAGLDGLHTADLPLYGAAAAHRWDLDRPVIVTEGEKAAAALVKAGWQAVGTVTGAGGCPNREPLLILAGHRALLWADNDQAGAMHMLKLRRTLGEPGEIAASIGWIVWRDAPEHGDAADAVAGGVDIGALVAEAGDPPVPQPPADLIDFAELIERRVETVATS